MALDYILLTDTFGHWVVTTNEIIDAINTQISAEMLSNLLTNDKTSLVGAINELYNTKYDKAGGTVSGNMVVQGNASMEGTLSVGKNGGGNATIQMFDDTANVYRDLIWDASAQIWKVEDKNNVLQNLFHSGSNINLGTFNNLVGDTQLQFKGGTTLQNNGYTGAVNEITVDVEDGSLRLHDGTTPGGIVISGGGGAGVEYRLVAGTNFTPGTAVLNFPVNVLPADKQFVEIFFNGLRQDQNDISAITATTIVMTENIPAGVTVIAVKVFD